MRFFRLFAVAALFSAIGSIARADIVTMLNGAPTQVDGGYLYTYNVTLAGGQLDATDGSSPVQFGTLYDFGPSVFVGATGLLGQEFIFEFQNISSPAAYKTTPTDDPNLGNVRYAYIGPNNVVVAGQPTTDSTYDLIGSEMGNLGTFTLLSPYGTTTQVNYDGQSFKGSNDTIQGNVGIVAAPSAVTPEPSSLVLLGTGLLSTAAAVRRRLTQAI